MRLLVHPEEGDLQQEAGRKSITNSASWLPGEAPVWEGPAYDNLAENDPIKTVQWPREYEVQGLSG